MSDTQPRSGRGIDHLVLAVRDLDAAAARYQALGFTLTPRAVHPWGTANRLVQLDGSFLEILTVAEPDSITGHGPGVFSFGAWNRDWLAKREGFSMLVFESQDHLADAREFAASELFCEVAPFEFARLATLPDGSQREVAFSLAFLVSEQLPDAVMFTCRQHAPELFWKPEFQRHANGARRVLEVAMVTHTPAEVAPLFGELHGAEALVEQTETRVRVRTARGDVVILTPEAFASGYGAQPSRTAPAGAHFAGCRIGVADLAAASDLLAANGVTTRWSEAGLTVPAEKLFGLTLVFSQA